MCHLGGRGKGAYVGRVSEPAPATGDEAASGDDAAGASGSPASSPEMPRLEGVTHRFVDLPGLRMHVAEAGAGEPVLLLHGFPQHWWEWHEMIPGLARQFHLVAPDLRGSGWTEAPSTGYDRDRLVADVVALLDVLGLDRVHVIGHDWGALLGFYFCMDHPERVRRFVSLAVPHPYVRFDRRMLRALPHGWYQLAIVAPGLGPRLLSSGRQWLPRYLFRHFAARPAVWSDVDIERYLAPLRDPARAQAAQALYRGFIQPEAARVFTGFYRGRRLTTPTLVLVGTEDPVVSADLLGGHENDADDLTVETVAGASHWIPEERPDLVVRRALAFLG
jgi:pimeloyl-ACP methyl ester carboxylesterase